MKRPGTGGLALTERQLAAALGTLGEAVTVQGLDGRPSFANAAALRMLGFPGLDAFLAAEPAEVLARYRCFRPDGNPMPYEDLPGRRVLLGDTPPPVLVRWIRTNGGDQRWSLIKATPLYDDEGTLVGAVNVIQDVTEATEADLSRRLLDEAARTLSSSLDYEQTLQHVARLAVPTLAEWCAVDLVDARGDIVSVAVAHVDPQHVEFARDLRRRYPIATDEPVGVAEVIRTGGTQVIPDITDEMLVVGARDAEHLAALRRLGLRSALIVPLNVADRVIGALTLVLSSEGRQFTVGDIALAEELGRRAGAAVQNARLYTQRGQISHVLQASLLPRELHDPPGWTHALWHQAAGDANEVGGDLYDLQPVGGGRWLALVGDVVGKGASAAALTPRVRHTLTAATALTGDPRRGLALLDAVLDAEPDPDRASCTAAAVVLAERDGRAIAQVACAGHPRPLLVRRGQATEIAAGGRMLGIERDPGDRTLQEVELQPGDTLVLYTDGITDTVAAAGRFGAERLVAALESAGPGASAAALVAAVRDAVEAFGDRPPADDRVLLALHRDR
jgi:serine phosphatase RsbU (regulator of sigma subunit)